MDSTRKRILDYVEQAIGAVPSIVTVERRLRSASELQEFATPQFPVVCIVGGLPVPRPKESRMSAAKTDLLTSDLTVECYVYLQDNAQTDDTISTSLSELWAALYTPPPQSVFGTRAGPILHWNLVPEAEVGYWPPFVAYILNVKVTYVHTTGGI